MMSSPPASRHPFDASHLTPGSSDYLWPPGVNSASLVAAWQAVGCRGLIVGPHGSGKTTLLHAITAEANFQSAIIIQVGRSPLPRLSRLIRQEKRFVRTDSPSWSHVIQLVPRAGTLVIDGWDSWNLWQRLTRLILIHRRDLKVLATSHKSGYWPTLLRVEPDLSVFRAWLHERLPSLSISDEKLAQVFQSRQGNFREAWFDLYDAFERGEISV